MVRYIITCKTGVISQFMGVITMENLSRTPTTPPSTVFPGYPGWQTRQQVRRRCRDGAHFDLPRPVSKQYCRQVCWRIPFAGTEYGSLNLSWCWFNNYCTSSINSRACCWFLPTAWIWRLQINQQLRQYYQILSVQSSNSNSFKRWGL